MPAFPAAARVAAFLLIMMLLVSPSITAGAPLQIIKREIKQKKPTHELEFSYPITGNKAIDSQVEGWARRLATEFSVDAEEARDDRPWSSELSYEVPRNDGTVLSLVFSHYTYTGGAHPNSSYRTFHFLLPDGYKAEIAELFSPRGIRRISDISIARLRRDLAGPDGMSDSDWIKRGAGSNPRNFASFVLTPVELRILFDAYQVAAYAAGPQEVRIPLERLRDTLRADPRAPAASFDCREAKGAIESAICSSVELARLDRALSEAYADALTWASDGTQRRSLQKSQRAWIALRDATCRRAGPNMGSCLKPLYETRIKALGRQ